MRQILVPAILFLAGCGTDASDTSLSDASRPGPSHDYQDPPADPPYIVISRSEYGDRLNGFWLGQSIANWTGLITEMDRIGGVGKDGRGAGCYFFFSAVPPAAAAGICGLIEVAFAFFVFSTASKPAV